MNCLNDNQLLLYQTQFGMTEPQRQEIDQHLQGCASCRQKKRTLEQELQQLKQGNRQECEFVRQNLPDYIENRLTGTTVASIAAHLEACELCHFLYVRNAGEPDPAKIEALNIPVPETLLPNLLKTVANEVARLARSQSTVTETFGSQLEAGIGQLIRLILQPAALQPAFLGEIPAGAHQIQHPGGDLQLAVGRPQIRVQIFSRDGRQLGEATSDEQGLVIFRDFEKAEYQITTPGFEILEVTYMEN